MLSQLIQSVSKFRCASSLAWNDIILAGSGDKVYRFHLAIPQRKLTFGILELICRNQGLFFIAGIGQQRPFKSDSLMFQANFQKQQEDADIDAVIMCHHGGRHDAPLSGLLVSVNRQPCLHRFHDPGLGIAGAGSEPGDIADIAVIRTMPHLIQRFALAFEHILSELVLGHFRNGDHDNKIQTVMGLFLCFANSEPQSADIHASEI